MPYRVRRLLHGDITYSAATEDETNILQKLTYVHLAAQFRSHLDGRRDQIATLVADHLGLSSSSFCQVAAINEWINGSFNLCIPVRLESSTSVVQSKRVLIRFPLPYKLGESKCPGNADEKLRCEAATYVWMMENCPDVPTPRLWSFGYYNGCCLTAVENNSTFTRCYFQLRARLLSLFGQPKPTPYISSPKKHNLGAGFLLMDYIEEAEGQMLSETWEEKRHDKHRREILFRDLSKIMLSVGRTSLPRIGSFTIDDHGIISLTNRPLTLELQQLENEDVQVGIPRDRTYTTTNAYVMDLLTCHRNRLISQLNAVNSSGDCMSQMSALIIMTAIAGQYFQRELCDGPFVLSLTDLHPSNIFVDKDWHVTRLIDLEWACVRPLEMQHPPYWLSGHAVDAIDVGTYNTSREEFLTALVQGQFNESCVTKGKDVDSIQYARTMQQGWENKNFWYSLALDSITGLHSIFYDHIQPRYDTSHVDDAKYYQIVSQYWDVNAKEFIVQKLEDKESYDKRLEYEFLIK
ncbi:MAG: hypothetical protein M1818_008082 [Claussenomyces sp. TS43310]|nr:MAG: hypothetical protein M1818_008082 [Claussenomyces sp. TS43310]